MDTPASPTKTNHILAAPAFAVGQRVEVTRGGFRDYQGTVTATWTNADGGTTVDMTLDSGILFYGSAHCLKAVAK